MICHTLPTPVEMAIWADVRPLPTTIMLVVFLGGDFAQKVGWKAGLSFEFCELRGGRRVHECMCYAPSLFEPGEGTSRW